MNLYNCLRLLNECIDAGLIQRSPKFRNYILIFRKGKDGAVEDCYEENLLVAAAELSKDVSDQKYLIEQLEAKSGKRFEVKTV